MQPVGDSQAPEAQDAGSSVALARPGVEFNFRGPNVRVHHHSLSPNTSLVRRTSAFRHDDSLERKLQHGVKGEAGPKGEMEDLSHVITFRNDVSRGSIDGDSVDAGLPFAMYSIYDGHGGVKAAEFAQRTLPLAITRSHEWHIGDVSAAIRRGFAEIDDQLLRSSDISPDCGTTASVCIFRGNKLYAANVGDGEIVLCRNGAPVLLSTLHRCSTATERLRVENAGGRITADGRLEHPAWNGSMVNLGITRSLGDAYYKLPEYTNNQSSGLSSEPSVQMVVLKKVDDFVLLATDGYWDVVTPERAVIFVRNMLQQKKPPNVICAELTQMAMVHDTRDNVTVMILTLHEETCELGDQFDDSPPAMSSGMQPELSAKKRRTDRSPL